MDHVLGQHKDQETIYTFVLIASSLSLNKIQCWSLSAIIFCVTGMVF
jgi:hypothetical protein